MDASSLILFNLFEAGLWFVIALILMVQWHRTRPRRWQLPAAALLLIAFSVSDLVETQTGAWWNPAWLFAWKAACVAGLLTLLIHARAQKNAASKQNPS